MFYGNYAPFYRGGYYNPMQPPIMSMTDNQNQFAQPYQAPIQQPQMSPTQMTVVNPNNDVIWVQGEAGAKAYLVAPNATVILWDSENPTIYVKSADASGIPSMRVLDFTERTQNAPKSQHTHQCQCSKEFVSQEIFNSLRLKFDDLESKYDSLSEKIESINANSQKTLKEETNNA